ncbi:MAG: 30S ribosomal protein S9 [Methanobacteriota archaeon]
MAAKVINVSGKRKTAIARAAVRRGVGRIRVNHVPIEIHRPELARLKILEPLQLAKDWAAKVDIDVEVSGGGIMGQAEAARTAIARGIIEMSEDDDLKALFLRYDRNLLVNDARRKEPKHPLGRGARKKRQKSYR